jgi:hypothetical protein
MRMGLLKKIKAFRKYLKENPEFVHEFPEVKELEACYAEDDSIYKNTCVCSKWPNGEGFHVYWYDESSEKHISLHDNEIETLLECLNKLNYFNID